MGRHNFLSIKDFSPEEIRYLLDLASEIKTHPAAHHGALKGKTLAMIFEKPSLRTRVSFDVGIQQLGGFSLYLSNAEINLGKRESLYDVAKNLERMVQGIMIRTYAHQIVEELAEYASIPIINGLTDYSHPCQAMADYLTMLELKGDLHRIASWNNRHFDSDPRSIPLAINIYRFSYRLVFVAGVKDNDVVAGNKS